MKIEVESLVFEEGRLKSAEQKDLGKVLSWCAETDDLSLLANWINNREENFSIVCIRRGNLLTLYSSNTKPNVREKPIAKIFSSKEEDVKTKDDVARLLLDMAGNFYCETCGKKLDGQDLYKLSPPCSISDWDIEDGHKRKEAVVCCGRFRMHDGIQQLSYAIPENIALERVMNIKKYWKCL